MVTVLKLLLLSPLRLLWYRLKEPFLFGEKSCNTPEFARLRSG
jgi:hypothetical protein